MRYTRVRWLVCLLSISFGPHLAHAGCAGPNLSSQIPDFQVLQTSRINALLRFGETYHLCFGVEYVDAALLTEVTDIQVRASTVGEAITSILGKERSLSVEVHEGVIQIGRASPESNLKGIFDHVLPAFESRRGPMQETSNLLQMYLVTDLNPEITGFAGHYFPGDLKDEVGPFREYNRSLRSLLNAILVQSKGGAWIARIAWRLRGDFKIPATRRIWTFVEYGMPSTGYAAILGNIAVDLEKDAPAASSGPNQPSEQVTDRSEGTPGTARYENEGVSSPVPHAPFLRVGLSQRPLSPSPGPPSSTTTRSSSRTVTALTAVPFLKQAVPPLELNKQTILDGLGKLNQATTGAGFALEFPLGQTVSGKAPSLRTFQVVLAPNTLGNVLDQLCQLDPTFSWQQIGTVINVFPRALENDKTYLFNRKLDILEFKGVPDGQAAVFQAVAELPPPREQIAIMQTGASINFAHPWTASFKDIMIREAFDKIAQQIGSNYGWQFTGAADFRLVNFYARLGTMPTNNPGQPKPAEQ